MQMLRLAEVNRLYLPIRDLLLLAVNIILGRSESGASAFIDMPHGEKSRHEW